MAVGDAYVFPGFLTPVLTQLFLPKPPFIFLTCFSRSERPKYAGQKVCLNHVSNSQPPSHESDTLNTVQLGQGKWVNKKKPLLTILGKKPFQNLVGKGENAGNHNFLYLPQCFLPFNQNISMLESHFAITLTLDKVQ